MWNKIYLIVLAAAILIIAVLTYLSFDWLGSVTNPKDVIENYEKYANLSWVFLWISTLVLLVLGNVVLWMTRKSWALWATFLYFAVFIVLQKFWLEQSFFQYKQAHNLTQSGFLLSPIFAVLFILLLGVIVFFNQFIVRRLQDKTFPQAQSAEQLPEESPANKNTV